MAGKVHLRFLGVFQPGTQIRQDLASLNPRAGSPGVNRITQLSDHLPNGLQFLRYSGTLGFKRVAFFVCSDQYHPNLCLLC